MRTGALGIATPSVFIFGGILVSADVCASHKIKKTIGPLPLLTASVTVAKPSKPTSSAPTLEVADSSTLLPPRVQSQRWSHFRRPDSQTHRRGTLRPVRRTG